MATTEPAPKSPSQKPAASRTAAPPRQAKADKADTLRRLSIWKNGVTAASVAGFIAISGVIVDQHTGKTSAAAAPTTAQVVSAWTAASAAAIPTATATPTSATAARITPARTNATAQTRTGTQAASRAALQTRPSTAANPAPLHTATKEAQKAAGTSVKRALTGVTAASTATPISTATPVATATPASTATAVATATPATQYAFGSTNQAQPPVAASSAS